MTSSSRQSTTNLLSDSIGADIVGADVGDYSIDGVLPEAVVTPNSIDQLGKTVSVANNAGLCSLNYKD